jgi:hypothetical protein
MEFNNLLDLLMKAYLVTIILSCLIRLFQGKVFNIKAPSIMLNMYFVLMLQFFPDIYPNNSIGKGYGGLVFNGALVFILTLAVFASNAKGQGINLFLGISEKNLVPTLIDTLAASQIEYKQSVNEITLMRNPEETFIHKPFLIGAGTYIIQSGTINSKANKPILIPLIKDTVRSFAQNWSCRFLLLILILFSLFILLF